MKFLVRNYSCLQNPLLGGYCPQTPVLSLLCPQLNLLNPPPRTKFLGTPLKGREICREGKCIIMASSLLICEYVQMLCFCGNGEAALSGRRYVGMKMHIYASASDCVMKIEAVIKRSGFQSKRRQQFTTQRLQPINQFKKNCPFLFYCKRIWNVQCHHGDASADNRR
jgi:hypothetical protein